MIKPSTIDNSENELEPSWKYQQRVAVFGDIKFFIKKQHSLGLTQKQIAVELNITDPTLTTWIRKLGLKLSRHKETKPRKNNTQQQAYDLKMSGLSYDKIAKQLGISRSRAYQKVQLWSSRITPENAQ